ncbi:MAG: hypothetical protein AAGA90_23700, partial [Actinomycetota bacterium]
GLVRHARRGDLAVSRFDFKPGNGRFGTCDRFTGQRYGTCMRCGKNHSTHLIAALLDAQEAAGLEVVA